MSKNENRAKSDNRNKWKDFLKDAQIMCKFYTKTKRQTDLNEAKVRVCLYIPLFEADKTE